MLIMQCINQIINPSDYELTAEELAIFMQLPEWHRAALLNWCDDWRLKDFVVDSGGILDIEPWDLPDNFPVNKYIIKKGLSACLDVDNSAANKLWMLHQKIVMNMTDSMYLDQLSKLIFPFQPYEFIARELESGLFALGFRENVISIDQLHTTLLKTDWLGVSAVIAFEIWSAYLRDWREYIAYLRKKDEARIFSFNQRTVSAVFGGTSFQSILVESKLDDHRNNILLSEHESEGGGRGKLLNTALDDLVYMQNSESQLSRSVNSFSRQSNPIRESTNERYAYYLKIYQQVVAEMGEGSRKGVLIAEAIQRAGCSEKTMRKAIQANK